MYLSGSSSVIDNACLLAFIVADKKFDILLLVYYWVYTVLGWYLIDIKIGFTDP